MEYPDGLLSQRLRSEEPMVSAINADLTGFPLTALSWGGDEMFRDPIRRFAECLRTAGVPTQATEVPGMFHDFQILVPWSPGSKKVFAQIARFVGDLVSAAPPLISESLAATRG